MHYSIELVHIDEIRPWDTIMFDGEMKTVCKNNIKKGGFCGTAIFGDSYKAGTRLVEKVVFKTHKHTTNIERWLE